MRQEAWASNGMARTADGGPVGRLVSIFGGFIAFCSSATCLFLCIRWSLILCALQSQSTGLRRMHIAICHLIYETSRALAAEACFC